VRGGKFKYVFFFQTFHFSMKLFCALGKEKYVCFQLK